MLVIDIITSWFLFSMRFEKSQSEQSLITIYISKSTRAALE